MNSDCGKSQPDPAMPENEGSEIGLPLADNNRMGTEVGW